MKPTRLAGVSSYGVLVLLLGLAACNKSHDEQQGASPPPSASPQGVGSGNGPHPEVRRLDDVLPPADTSVTALLGGLKSGDKLGPAHVDQVFGVSEGRFAVRVVSDGSLGWAEVTLRSEDPPPPVSTNRYSVYWTMRGQSTNRMTDPVMGQVCVALGERLRVTEEQTPVPEGMKPFPKPQFPGPPL